MGLTKGDQFTAARRALGLTGTRAIVVDSVEWP